MAKSSASGIKAGRAYVELGVDDRFTKALRAAQARLQAFGNAVRNIGLGLSALAAAASAPFIASVKLFSEFGDSIDKAAARFSVRTSCARSRASRSGDRACNAWRLPRDPWS